MTGRLHTLAFVALCLAGAAAAVGLTVREVARTAPIAMSVTNTTRTGTTTDVTITVRNRTDVTRCVSVRVAARDRSGHDLAAVTAQRELSLEPHQVRVVHASLRLTVREYAEQLHAFYPSSRPCADSESAP